MAGGGGGLETGMETHCQSQQHTLTFLALLKCFIKTSGLEIRVDWWPESTKNPVRPPI